MNTTTPDESPLAGDKTVVAPRKRQEDRACPACGTANALGPLQQREYRCGKCNLELAHLDYAPNGAVRGVFGWLLAVGDVVLDRYQIKSVLGKGGFGAAYLVDDLQLSGKRRALKEVPEMLFDEYETSLLSRLDHPAIPDIIERRAANGMVYLSLKFGGSRTLGSERKLYPDRRVPMGKLFPWMRQLCEVLVYLHSQTPPIIHRDLKPDNILLNEDERIMLVDFGIAKEAVPQAMTRTLGRAATYGFSPPEQVMGTGTDERSDIYALGATFYALLTGQNPPPAHERVAGAELLPPSQFVPDLPLDVEEAIIQSLSLNMNQRQRSVKEFALRLGGMEAGSASRLLWAGASIAGEAGSASFGNTARPKPAAVPDRMASTAVPRPDSQRNAALALAGIAVALAALATGAYFYFSKTVPVGGSQPTAVHAVSPAQPPLAQPVQGDRASPTAPFASPIATPTPVPSASPSPSLPEQRPANVPPPAQPAVQSPPPTAPLKEEAGSPSTEHTLEQAPKAQPKQRPVSVSPPQPAASKPVAKAHPAVPAEQIARPVINRPLLREGVRKRIEAVERGNPKPAGGPAPSWTIIPGGARKTD
jgi:serine/threonine protein kinase/ribosomal protein S27AE